MTITLYKDNRLDRPVKYGLTVLALRFWSSDTAGISWPIERRVAHFLAVDLGVSNRAEDFSGIVDHIVSERIGA